MFLTYEKARFFMIKTRYKSISSIALFRSVFVNFIYFDLHDLFAQEMLGVDGVYGQTGHQGPPSVASGPRNYAQGRWCQKIGIKFNL